MALTIVTHVKHLYDRANYLTKDMLTAAMESHALSFTSEQTQMKVHCVAKQETHSNKASSLSTGTPHCRWVASFEQSSPK